MPLAPVFGGAVGASKAEYCWLLPLPVRYLKPSTFPISKLDSPWKAHQSKMDMVAFLLTLLAGRDEPVELADGGD